MKNKSFLILTCALLSSAPVAQAFDLSQAWRAARTNSADYRAATFNRDAEIEREKQAKAALLPQVSLSGSYTYQPPSLSSTRTTRNANIQLNQTIYDGSKWAQYRLSKLNSQAAESELRHNHDDTLLKVSESYFNVLLAKDTIRAVEAERQAYRQQMKQASEMYERGAATAVDIHEAQAGYDNAVAKEIEAITRKQIAENQLSNYTGLDVEKIEAVPMNHLIERVQPKVKQHSLAQWQDLALKNNHEYQNVKLNAEMADEGVNMARASRLPKVSVSVGYQHSRYQGSQAQQDYAYTGKGLSASLQVSVPLYTGGEIRSKVREAAARSGEAESKLLSVERKVKLAVKQAFTENNALRYQVLAQERLLNSNRLKLKSTRTGKDFGVRSTLEVMKAQQEVADSEQKLAEARYRYLQSFLTLIKESGMDMETAWLATRGQAVQPTSAFPVKHHQNMKPKRKYKRKRV